MSDDDMHASDLPGAERATALDDDPGLEYDSAVEDDWQTEPDELPPRRRRKLLSPVPLALLAALLIAAGFLAGVEIEKGQAGSGSSASGFAGIAALRAKGTAAGGAGTSSRGSAGSLPSFAGLGGGALTSGEVSYVSGDTLYVTDSEGTTIKVKAPAGTKVSKTVSTAVHSIHPGETVVVRGAGHSDGSVTADSISVGSGAALASSGTGGSGSTASGGSGASGGGSTPQLFGSG
jgi:hypothetical protein